MIEVYWGRVDPGSSRVVCVGYTSDVWSGVDVSLTLGSEVVSHRGDVSPSTHGDPSRVVREDRHV